MDEKQRTIQQNKALHKYFEQLAEALNNEGLDMRIVLKPEIDIPWNKDTVKEFLWKPVQRLQVGKDSTTELLKDGDIDKIYETLNRFMGEKFFVHVPFPSIETLMNE